MFRKTLTAATIPGWPTCITNISAMNIFTSVKQGVFPFPIFTLSPFYGMRWEENVVLTYSKLKTKGDGTLQTWHGNLI